MLVQHILPRARERLAAVDAGASIAEAALAMTRPDTDLLVVCDGEAAVGVLTKSDIVAQVARDVVAPLSSAGVATIMTRQIVSCRATDLLYEVWKAHRRHGRQRIPVLDEAGRPVGVLYARDALQALLCEAETEDELLREYIQGVGYH